LTAISTVIITLNEEYNIERCLNSVKDISDEIIVVDSFSTDKTADICKKNHVNFSENKFIDYANQKNYANELCKNDYILSIDADEELSKELIKEIKRIKEITLFDGYSFNRLTNYCGKWVKHSGWYPDKKLRLFNKHKFSWNNGLHEKLESNTQVNIKHIPKDILHHSYPSISSHVKQMNSFSTLAANEAYEKKKKINFFIHLVLYPFITFIKNYFLKLGFLDGKTGFIVCVHKAYYRYLKYSKLYNNYSK